LSSREKARGIWWLDTNFTLQQGLGRDRRLSLMQAERNEPYCTYLDTAILDGGSKIGIEDRPMELSLSPASEKLVDAKIQSGEFESRDAVVEYALRLLGKSEPNGKQTPLWAIASPEEQANALEEWVAGLPKGPGLPDDAVSRDSIYD